MLQCIVKFFLVLFYPVFVKHNYRCENMRFRQLLNFAENVPTKSCDNLSI